MVPQECDWGGRGESQGQDCAAGIWGNRGDRDSWDFWDFWDFWENWENWDF